MNRDYDTYNNFETTDFNSNPLINPKLNDYFNNIINQPEPQRNYTIMSKSDYTWSKFYNDYIEPNMLFIIIIIGFVIFFLIRYYTMDYDAIDDNDTNTTLDKLEDSDDSSIDSRSKKKYKAKLKKYKKDLDDEKRKILHVIDELSSINYEEKNYYSSLENNYNQQLHQIKELQKKQEMQDLEEIRQLKELQEQIVSGNIIPSKQNQQNQQIKVKNSNQSKKFVEPDRHPLDLTIKNNDTETDEDSNYYNIKKYDKKNKDDFISDIYIEPPYN